MNVLDIDFRARVIKDINSDENKRRKAESEKRFQVYADNQKPYVLNMLANEFSAEQVREMRTLTSINLTKRVVNSQASIYRNPPKRNFGDDVSEKQEEQLEALYKYAKVNQKLKDANRKYKLHQQCAVQVIPNYAAKTIEIKNLRPHHYDVVPDPMNPEEAFAYVLSGWDRWVAGASITPSPDIQGNAIGSQNAMLYSDGYNELIGDPNDAMPIYEEGPVYVWWTKDYHFRTNEDGVIIDPEIVNPLGELPFIDVSAEKDLKFWAAEGSNAVDFNLDFSVVLSDTCNTNRLQGYAQAVVTAEKMPEQLSLGPNRCLFLQFDKNRPEAKPEFAFVSPNPDLASSLTLQDRLLSYFLTSNGIDPKTISGSGQAEKFTSGLDRLLSMIEEFEASQDDYEKFAEVELKLGRLLIKWSNLLQSAQGVLIDALRGGTIDENVAVEAVFAGPQDVQTKSEEQNLIIQRSQAGLMSRVKAYMALNDVTEEQAKKDLKEIDMELVSLARNSRMIDNGNSSTESADSGSNPVGE